MGDPRGAPRTERLVRRDRRLSVDPVVAARARTAEQFDVEDEEADRREVRDRPMEAVAGLPQPGRASWTALEGDPDRGSGGLRARPTVASMTGLTARPTAFAARSRGTPVEDPARGNAPGLRRGIRRREVRRRRAEPSVFRLEPPRFLAEHAQLLLELLEAPELADELSALLVVLDDNGAVTGLESEEEILRGQGALRQEGNGHPDIQFGYARCYESARAGQSRILSCYFRRTGHLNFPPSNTSRVQVPSMISERDCQGIARNI
jgi:hypothetical protein